jgi:hypothetical protein
LVATLELKTKSCNSGLALNADCTVAAVSSLITNTITLYSLPSGKVIRKFGKKGSAPGQFNGPEALCFGHSGNLFVADSANARVQELTLTGDVVRIIGVGLITEGVSGLDVNHDVIVVSKPHSAREQIFVLDYRTGSVIRSFGESGRRVGQLYLCRRVHITADGRHIIAGEQMQRVSMFTVTGQFVKCVTTQEIGGGVRDAIPTTSDELIVGHCDGCQLAVFSMSTGRLLRQFGPEIITDGPQHSASCIAIGNGRLFELVWSGPYLHVFE